MDKLEKAVNRFTDHLRDALSWLLPVSVIMITFILLFFGISEQVGHLSATTAMLYSEVNTIKSQLPQVKASKSDVPLKENDDSIYKNGRNLVKDIKVGRQTIELAGGMYWGYSFSGNNDSKQLSIPVITPLKLSSGYTLVVNYYALEDFSRDTSVPDPLEPRVAFELFPLFNRGNSTIGINNEPDGYSAIAVFVDGKLVLMNEFDINSTRNDASIKKVLTAIKDSDKSSEEIKKAASNELKMFN
jgi:hypothetical protein